MFTRRAMGKEFEGTVTGRNLNKLTAITPKATVIMEKVYQVQLLIMCEQYYHNQRNLS